MVSIGTKIVGLRQKISEDAEVKKDVYYETVTTLDKSPPFGQELEFLLYVKERIESEQNVYVNYAEIDGNKLTVQYKSLGSPINVGVIIALIIATALVYGIYLITREVYQILTFLGPETSGLIFQIFAFMLILYFMSMVMSFIPRPGR